MSFGRRIAARSLRKTCLSAFAGIVATAALAGAVLAQTPSASQLAAAKDLVLATGITRSFNVLVPQILVQIRETVTRTRPEYADDLDVVLKQLQPEFLAHNSEIVDMAAQIFSKRMTEQELKDAAVFFNSPSGKKYVDAQSANIDELVEGIQNWTQRMSGEIMDRVRVEMKKKGHAL